MDFYFISNSDVDALLAGRFYINVHTEMYDMGEIRGYLVPVPEPGSAAVLGRHDRRARFAGLRQDLFPAAVLHPRRVQVWCPGRLNCWNLVAPARFRGSLFR